MSGGEMPAVASRPRRRRALASAWRQAALQEAALPPEVVTDTAGLEERLRAIADDAGIALPPGTDLAEMMARLPHGGGLPPEWLPVLATLLLPLFRPDPAPRSATR